MENKEIFNLTRKYGPRVLSKKDGIIIPSPIRTSLYEDKIILSGIEDGCLGCPGIFYNIREINLRNGVLSVNGIVPEILQNPNRVIVYPSIPQEYPLEIKGKKVLILDQGGSDNLVKLIENARVGRRINSEDDCIENLVEFLVFFERTFKPSQIIFDTKDNISVNRRIEI